jgi:hypothetical protein
VHRLNFPNATISVTGTAATINTGNVGPHNHDGTYEPVINPKNTAFNKNFGTGNTEVARGDHNHAGTYATPASVTAVDNALTTHKASGDHDAHNDARYATQASVNTVDAALTTHKGSGDHDAHNDARYATQASVNTVDAALTTHKGSGDHDAHNDARYATTASVDAKFLDAAGNPAADKVTYSRSTLDDKFQDAAGNPSGDKQTYSKATEDGLFHKITDFNNHKLATSTDHDGHNDGRYYTQTYLAGNMKIMNDLAAPNVNNDGGGNPDPNLGFDISITFPNNLVANPTIMLWGYYVEASVGYAIKKITFTPSIAGATLTLNCMVRDLANFLYDKGVFGGNWANRTLYLNYVVINL